ncbi:hypothetical protein [Devosia sp. A16]|uniref:hypothetical protein n=1 Tax=Devosia sp. A16 TaxID=1736675 RepID=UPI0006D78C64|nr:hypothetical protein [Devosia sp. A16]
MFSFSQRERLVVSYIWLFGSRLFGIYLVMYVLGRATDRTEILIVTVAGMMYGVLSSLMYLLQYQTLTVVKIVTESAFFAVRDGNKSLDISNEDRKLKEFFNEKVSQRQYRVGILQLTSLIIFVLCFMRFAPLFSLFGG